MTNGNKSANKQGVQFDVAPLPNQEAIVHFKDKVLLDSSSYLDVLAHEHAIAFVVAGMADADLLAETKAAIQSALDSGSDFNAFKRRLKPYLTAKGWLSKDGKTASRRLRLIYHTNLHTAYAAGQWQRIQKTKEFLPYLQYMPSVSENPRLSHKRYYDLVRPVDDAIWQQIFPPNSYNCKCWVKQLTKRQAQKVGISEETPLEMVDYENPKTGEKSQVPAGIDPSFNHNHDRLTALLKLAQEKHGVEFAQKLGVDLKGEMVGYAVKGGITHIDFRGITPRVGEVARLEKELGDNKPKPFEGALADEWQQKFDVELVRFDPNIHKVMLSNEKTGTPKSADYAVIAKDSEPKDWVTIDFLFAFDDTQAKAMAHQILESKNKRHADAWDRVKDTIDEHLLKADIVPMDLRKADARIATKIIAYVLSLPKEKQKQIVFVVE